MGSGELPRKESVRIAAIKQHAGGALFLLGYRLRANWANMERYFWRALDKVEEKRKRDQNKHLLQFLWKASWVLFS